MAVPSSIADLDAVAANNSPAGSEAIGTALDDYLRAHASIIKQVSNFTQSGSGAISRAGQDKMREIVSVSDFGAVGDGVNDDTAEIQAALDSGAKMVFVPAGNYLASSSITIPQGVTLRGENVYSTTLSTDGAGSSINFIRLNSNAVFADMTVDMNGRPVSTGVIISSMTKARVSNVRVTNCGYHGIALLSSTYCTIENVETDNNGERGVIIDPASFRNKVSNLYSHDNIKAGFLIGHGSADNIVENFILENNNNVQAWIHNESYNNVVKNGVIRSPGDISKPAMLLHGNAHHNIVSGIVIEGHQEGILIRGAPVDVGLTDGDTRENNISNVIIIGAGSGVADSVGVYFESTDGGVTKASKNVLSNVSISAMENGFKPLNAGDTDTSGNIIKNCDASNSVTYPWRFGTTTPGAGNNKVKNLDGYTPVGSLTAAGQPAVPATGVAVLNPFPFDCSVYISGLVTGVLINGTNTNSVQHDSGNGVHILCAGQTIALLYSSGSPAWRWFGL